MSLEERAEDSPAMLVIRHPKLLDITERLIIN